MVCNLHGIAACRYTCNVLCSGTIRPEITVWWYSTCYLQCYAAIGSGRTGGILHRTGNIHFLNKRGSTYANTLIVDGGTCCTRETPVYIGVTAKNRLDDVFRQSVGIAEEIDGKCLRRGIPVKMHIMPGVVLYISQLVNGAARMYHIPVSHKGNMVIARI